MTYRVTLVVRNAPAWAQHGPTRVVTTCLAGCQDEQDALRKARALYQVVQVKKVEAVA